MVVDIVMASVGVCRPEDRPPRLDSSRPHPSTEQHQHSAGQEPRQVDHQDRQGLAHFGQVPMAKATPTRTTVGP
jgi:hypothetical protein